MTTPHPKNEGILLIDKPTGITSFKLVAVLRRILDVQKIGHTGTLDPFATGVMVLLIGKNYTRFSDKLMASRKEYVAELLLGSATDSYDRDGVTTVESTYIPSLEEVEAVIARFQGTIQQIPPMFSAKKINGQKLYDLARKGLSVERQPISIDVTTTLVSYEYPRLTIHVACDKGTYIRTIAHDIGFQLGSHAHLHELQRTKSGEFAIDSCLQGSLLFDETLSLEQRKLAVREKLLKLAS